MWITTTLRSAALLSVFFAAESVHAQNGALQEKINVAIESGVDYLRTQQHRDGSWTGSMIGSYRAGPTAFTAYALVESGVSPDEPCIQLALSYLYSHRPTMTYSAGSLLLLLAEIGGDAHEDLAQETLDQLVDWENGSLRGSWAYPSGQIDLSNTQFAALGFWAADRLGLDVPVDVCKRMVMTTIDAHQDEPAPATKEDPSETTRTRAGKRTMAGFMYLPNNRTKPARGSMTVAGICVQRFAQEIHGRKLGNKVLQASVASEKLAMRWLFEFWDPKKNPGMDTDDGQILYYLWGIERLGALLGRDELFGVNWYVAGATEIVAKQEDSGSWGRYHETVYSLLFLTRATRREAFSGRKRKASAPGAPRSQTVGPVHFTVTGTMELTMWVTGLDEAVHVDRIEWCADGQVIATVEGDGKRRWDGERFAARWSPGLAGAHSLTARAHVRWQDPDTGTMQAEVHASKPLSVTTRWSPDEWMRMAYEAQGENLLEGAEVTVAASSEAAGQFPSRAADGLEGTAWVATADDTVPRIELTPQRPVRAASVTLSHPASRTSTVTQFAGVTRVRITVNGKDPFEAELPSQSAAVIAIPLPKKTRVRTLVVEILEVGEGPAGKRGFAEIGLR